MKAPAAEVDNPFAEQTEHERLHELVCAKMFGNTPPPSGLELMYDALLKLTNDKGTI